MAETVLTNNRYCFQIEDGIVTMYFTSTREPVGNISYVIRQTDEPEKYLGQPRRYIDELLPVPVKAIDVSRLRSRAEVLFNRKNFLESISDPLAADANVAYTKAVQDYKEASGQITPVRAVDIVVTPSNPMTITRGVRSDLVTADVVYSDDSEIPIPYSEWGVGSGLTLQDGRLYAVYTGTYKINLVKDDIRTTWIIEVVEPS